MKKKWFIFLIVSLLVTAFVVRFYNVTQSPPAPYWEEVALGYDAYSLLKTGKDHHGNPWPLVAVESFGDWKPSGYFYALVPFIALFDLSVLAVRLPSILAGTGIVFFLGWFTWLMSESWASHKQRKQLALLSMLLATFSPWLIQFSRGGWEVNLATFYILASLCFGWASVSREEKTHNFRFIVISLIFSVLALYTYHSARVIAPVLGLFLGLRFVLSSYKTHPKVAQKEFSLILLLLFIFLLPFIKSWGSPVLSQRMAETTIFSDIAFIEESNALKNTHQNAWWTRLVYHRYFFYGKAIISQFFSHLRPDFLFVSGDSIARHSSQYFGLFYPFEIIFLLFGAWYIFRFFSKEQKVLLLLWFVIGILPAALSRPVPHALRILPVAPLLLFSITIGIWQLFYKGETLWKHIFPKLKAIFVPFFLVSFIIIYLGSFCAFYKHLLFVYPERYGSEWQQGYESMIEKVTALQKTYPEHPVYITREQGRPAMYYWFYTKTNPLEVQQADSLSKQDQGEFLEFQNLHFVNSLSEATNTPAITAHFSGQWEVNLLP